MTLRYPILRAAALALTASLAGLLAAPALALDLKPAALHLTLTDDDHHPIANAAITLTVPGGKQPAPSFSTDAQGRATLTQSAPDLVSWDAALSIRAPGFAPLENHLSLFTHADLDYAIQLSKLRTTPITLLDDHRNPLPHIPLILSSGNTWPQSTTFLTTDSHGQCTWTHAALSRDFTLALPGTTLTFPPDAALAITLTPRRRWWCRNWSTARSGRNCWDRSRAVSGGR
ncbi:MAG TPA: Ig-like domain-containing protein [Phycisphaerae bacterium]|nr:Ig-like domain-containing protein [Phycisphaerae bacterium]